MAIAAAAIAGAVALGGTIYQGIRARKAKKKAEQLAAEGRALDDSREFTKNQQLAEQVANLGGMSSQEYQNALQGIQRNQAAALSALGSKRSAIGGISRLVQASNDAQANLDARNAAVSRANKITGTQMQMQANQAKAARRAAQLNRDFFQPSQEATAESQALTGAAIQNAMGVVNAGAQIGMLKGMNNDAGSTPPARTYGAGSDITSGLNYRIPRYRVKTQYSY